MKIARTFVGIVVAIAFLTLTGSAQQASPGYHSVACFKLKPDSAAEFRKFVTDDAHKVAEGRVGDGELTAWYRLRAVFPQGEAAACDYLVIAVFPRMPHEFQRENLDAAIKKAGLSITPDDYFKHRDSVVRLVSAAVYKNQTSVGSPKKGDYFQVNYMKVSEDNINDWVAYEKQVWKPVAEALVKDGKQDGWSLNVRSMPFGSDLPFQGVTVDVYPSADAVFENDPQFIERFRKVHPDMEFGTTIEHFEKLRTQAMVELYVLEDIVTAH
ncbi:MAG: hypothetical protein JO300_07560 [Silvibacterium sp.]|nr:hypothetical protein [Silvibacterium sp.]